MTFSTLAVFIIYSFSTPYADKVVANSIEGDHQGDDEKIDLSQIGWRLFGKPIENNHRMYVERWGNPEERGPYFEGDLLNPNNPKNGIKHESFLWKNREIPYEIRGSFRELSTHPFHELSR